MEENRIYYLYCSLEAFLSIVNNKTIRLGDPLKMNDRTELLSLYQKLDVYIHKNNKKNDYSKIVIKMLKKFLDNGQNHLYIACFSEEPDLLSQWICYGDKGNGVAIGFDIDKIRERDDRLSIEKVSYIKEIDNSIYNSIISSFYAASSSSYISSIVSKKRNTVFYEILTNNSVKYKDSSFSAEKEWRLIYKRQDADWESDDMSSYISEMKEIKHCVFGTNDIKSYIELELEPGDIKKIVLGPKCNMQKKEVAEFLVSKFNVFKNGQNSIIKSKMVNLN